MFFNLIIFAFLGYLLGSLPTGYLITKWVKGVDIRKMGSGNIGATNVARCVSKTAGFFTLFIDFGKGFLPLLILHFAFPSFPFYSLVLGASLIAGHIWSIFLKFKGGKGVATAFGVFLALSPWPTLLSLLFFFLLAKISSHISVGSLGAAIIFPPLVVLFGYPSEIIYFAIFCSLFIIIRHRSNIQRLIEGKEEKSPLDKGGNK